MFMKRLRILLNYHTRVTCSKFYSNNHLSKINLTFSHDRLERNNVHSKTELLPIYTVRPYSNVLINTDHELNNDDDNSSANLNSIKNGMYRFTENGYMYDLLKKSEKCNTILPSIVPEKNIPDNVVKDILTKDYEDFNVTELIDDFKTLSYDAKLNSILPLEELHGKLLRLLEKYVSDMVDENLWDLLRCIELWLPCGKLFPEQFINLLVAIDKSLHSRMSDFTPDEMLTSCDLIFRLRPPTQSKLIDRVILKLGNKPKKMSPGNYLHFMYLINITKKIPFNMYELEYALEPIVHMFDANELGLIAAAFFKTKTSLKNPVLLDKIIEKCTADMTSMRDISLSAVLKIMRLSLLMKKNLISVKKMYKALESRLEVSSVPTLVHAGHLAAVILLPEENLISKIFERFKTDIPNARVKDLERMLFVLVMYNHPKESPIYELIVKEMRKPERADEYLKFYKSFSASLLYLSHAGIYPIDLIQKALNHNYLSEVYKNNAFKIGPSYLSLEMSLKIEVPEYNGPTLPPRILNYLIKRHIASIARNQNPEIHMQWHQRLLFEISNHAKEILGTDRLIIEQLLPHYERADIIYCIDTNDNSVSQKFMSESLMGPIKYAPTVPEGHKWIAIVIASYNQVFRGTEITCGTINAKLRQLEKIGYTPVVVLASIWRELSIPEAKNKYLQSCLSKIDFGNMEGAMKND